MRKRYAVVFVFALAVVGCSSSGRSSTDGGSSPNGALPSLPTATGSGRFAIPGRMEDAIEVVLPASRPAKPPLVVAFHGTGGEPLDMVTAYDLVAKAASLGFVAIAPRAGYRNGVHPADVDHSVDSGDSSWNMWIADSQQNDDLVYLRALIDAASAQWDVDATRVYTLGFSNGAYFSYFAAASMPDRIAGFAENSGGWMTDACATRTDASGTSLYLLSTTAPAGQDMPCSTIFADPAFPQQCRVTASNPLRPPKLGGRVPFGYLGHYSVDDGVSVVWSCLLAEGLGARAQTRIRASDTDGTSGHSPMPNFIDGAWAFFAGRTTAQ
jgi:poly(3-hydroxybutyrate) depolymerase